MKNVQDNDEVLINKHHHISSHKDVNNNANSNDHNSLMSHHSSGINDYPPIKISLPVASSKYGNEEISSSINENIPNDGENYMDEERRNLLNTFNENNSVNEDHSNNGPILRNEEVSTDDDMILKDVLNSDADGSLEVVGDTVHAPKDRKKTYDKSSSVEKLKLDTHSSEAQDYIEIKSMYDENAMELDERK
jgi:hypothetical protein